MRHRFRDKLIAAFLLLLVITVVPVLVLVNTQIDTISEVKIEQDLANTRRVFERLQDSQVASFSQRTQTFILTQPDIRAEIASAGVSTESLFERILGGEGDGQGGAPGGGDPFAAAPQGAGDPFAAGGGQAAAAETADQQNRIRSVVQEVALYNEAAVFFLTDFQGNLLFSKAAEQVPNTPLADIVEVRAALQGREVFTWWAASTAAVAQAPLIPEAGRQAIYRMFLRPVAFDGEVKGLLGIGFELMPEDVRTITGITQSEVAFMAGGTVYLNSHGDLPAQTLAAVAAQGAGPGAAADAGAEGGTDRAAPATLPFAALGEEFLAQPVPVLSTLGQVVGTVLVYRSKTREQAVFNDLRTILNAIGVAALVVAGLLALGISASVARVVRQLFHGVTAVRAGDLDVQLAIRSRDEFGELGRAFNEMTAGLKEKEQIRSTFKRYVSSTVVDELLRSADSVKLGGESKQLTIQFSDIAGFTSISEALTPEQVVEFLNAYLSQMTAEVEAESGIVDKYIGDAVMAFWGAPLPLPGHADHACRAALRQMHQVAGLREGWAGRGDLSRFDVRIGLHSGEVVVGNIGSDTRMDYTIIGDSVNTASRLEGMNKLYGTNILISEDTLRLTEGRFATRELDRIRVVGKTQPVRIYELVGEAGDGDTAARPAAATHERFAEVHDRFAGALALYREGRFEEAEAHFAALAQQAGDRPAEAFRRRCAEYRNAPPPSDWNGVYTSTSK